MNRKTINDFTFELTGESAVDRETIFRYIFKHQKNDTISPEILVLAASFLPINLNEFNDEMKKDDVFYTNVMLNIIKEPTLDIFRRRDIGLFLERYLRQKDPRPKLKNRQIFDFTNEFEVKLYEKLSNLSFKKAELTLPFFHIYVQNARIAEEMGDEQTAFIMYSKANFWNPLSPKVLRKICEGLKKDKNSEDLLRISIWLLKIVYSLENITLAMRYAGYALYLKGQFAQSYAFYYQSLIYENNETTPKSLNDEIMSVLKAMDIDKPYTLTRSNIKKLFVGKNMEPFPSELVFDVVRDLIISHYLKQEHGEVLRYTGHYLKHRPSDQKIRRFDASSKLSLN